MRVITLATSAVGPPLNVLEFAFLIVLGGMVVASGLVGLVVVTRMVEPGGVKVLLRRLAGKSS